MALGTNGTLTYLLEVDDQGSPVIKKFSGNVDAVGTASKKTTARTNKLNKSLLGMKTAIAGLGLGLVAKKILDSGRNFEASVSDLSAITGATGDNLDFMRKKALEFSKQTTQSAQDSVEAFKLVASAKPDLLDNASALAQVTREAIRLSEASGTGLATSAKTVGSALNQFSADADQASRFVNVLAAGAKFGASEIDTTAQALKMAGVVAAQTGLSFEQTNAAIQLLAAGALKGSEAGTGLRGVLLKLSTQTNDQFNPAIVGLEQALINLKEADLSATEQKKLFGEESIVAAKLLIKEAGSVGQLTEKLTGTNTAMVQATTKTNNLNSDIDRLTNTFTTLGIGAEGTANVGLRAIVQGITEIIGKQSEAVDGSQKVSITIASFADIMGTFAREMALPFAVAIDSVSATAAAISLLMDGEFTAATKVAGLAIDDIQKNFTDLVDPAIANRFENLARKMIADMQAADKASKLTSTVDGSQIPGAVARINQSLSQIPREVVTVHRVVGGFGGGGAAAAQGVQGSRATGGYIPRDGFYQLHAGERVVSNAQSFGDINITVPAGSGDGINWRDVVRNKIMPEIAMAAR